MRVLIVECDPELCAVWANHISRYGVTVLTARSQADAIEVLQRMNVELILLNLVLEQGSAMAIADFASYRWPDTKVLFVTNTTFFSDGSIFQHMPNACALVQKTTRPEDIAAMVDYYGTPRVKKSSPPDDAVLTNLAAD